MNQPTKVGLLVPILAILPVMACTSSGSKPTFQPIPTPTTPPGFVKYSDELSSFSIEYPREWQLVTSQMTFIEGQVKDFVEGKGDYSLDSVASVFFAGDADRRYTVGINVESLQSNMTLDEFAEGAAAFAEELFPSFQVHRISKVQVGGKPAVLVEATFEASDFDPSLSGSVQQTLLTFLLGKAAWTVACGYPGDPGSAQTCESVVRTIRILE